MKRIGKGDYAWSVTHAGLEKMAGILGEQTATHIAGHDTLMAVGTARLAARCCLDFTDTEAREKLARPIDVHYARDANPKQPVCGWKPAHAGEIPATTTSRTGPNCRACTEIVRMEESPN